MHVLHLKTKYPIIGDAWERDTFILSEVPFVSVKNSVFETES